MSTSGPRRAIGFVLRGVLAVAFLAAISSAGIIAAGERAFLSSTVALEEGDGPTAVRGAKRAALWYVPGAPHVDRAYVRLTAIAEAATARGEIALGMQAWQAVREASLETRSVFTPHASDLEAADRALAKLYALAPDTPTTRALGPEGREQRFLRDLLQEPGTTTGWAIALAASLFAVGASLAWIALFSVDHAGNIAQPRLNRGLLALALSCGLWFIALYYA